MNIETVKAQEIEGLHHETISGLVDGIGQTSKNNANHCAWPSMLRSSKSWLGLPDLDQTVTAINKGWSDGVSKVLDATNDLHIDIESTCIRRRRRRADFGDEIDMQRVYTGDIDRAWSTTTRQRTNAPKQITLQIDIGAACNVESSELFWRGAAALYLADKLTESGFQVAINGCAACRMKARKGIVFSGTLFNIKSFDEPLNLPSLAATVCLSGFMRTAFFSKLLRAPFKAPANLGSPINFESHYGEQDDGKLTGFEAISSKHGAIDFIKKTLEGMA